MISKNTIGRIIQRTTRKERGPIMPRPDSNIGMEAPIMNHTDRIIDYYTGTVSSWSTVWTAS